MSQTTVAIVVALIGALGTAITAFVGWLTKKGLNYLDAKTKFMDEANQIQKKDDVKKQVAEAAELATMSTMQTYVDELKVKNADGKLTKDEAKEALRKTKEAATAILKSEGIEVGKEVLGATIEAVVSKLKGNQLGNSSRGAAVQPSPAA